MLTLLMFVADGGTVHTTWSLWHTLFAYASIIGLVVWIFKKMGEDLGPPVDDDQPPPPPGRRRRQQITDAVRPRRSTPPLPPARSRASGFLLFIHASRL